MFAKIVRDIFSSIHRIRKATYQRLKLLSGGVLSAVLRQILSRDPIAPVLWEPHYDALDRRLDTLIKTVDDCIAKHSESYVLIEDDFSYIHDSFGALKTFYTHYSYDPGHP